MSVAASVLAKVSRLQRGKPFNIKSFMELGSSAAIRKALSRLTQKGVLLRVAHGVYVKPKKNRFFGSVLPSQEAIVRSIAKRNNEKLQLYGAETARRFGISTQSSLSPVFYTSGSTRKLNMANGTVRLKHLNPTYLKYAGTQLGNALATFLYLGKKHLNLPDFEKVMDQLTSYEKNQFEKMLNTLPIWLSRIYSTSINAT